MAHIWACPPSEGDDYIFHIHPQEQKIPKPKRLQDWYRKMLDKGIVELTVTDYKVGHEAEFVLRKKIQRTNVLRKRKRKTSGQQVAPGERGGFAVV